MSLLDADLKYEMEDEFRGARIKVIGVGGGGSIVSSRSGDLVCHRSGLLGSCLDRGFAV